MMAFSAITELKISRNIARTIAATFKGKITNRNTESVHKRGASYSVFEQFEVEQAIPADVYRINFYKDLFDYNDQGKQYVDVGNSSLTQQLSQELQQPTAAITPTIKTAAINFEVTVSGMTDLNGHGKLLLRIENVTAYASDVVSIMYHGANLLDDRLIKQRLQMLNEIVIQRTPTLKYIQL